MEKGAKYFVNLYFQNSSFLVKTLVGISLVVCAVGRWAQNGIKNGSLLKTLKYQQLKSMRESTVWTRIMFEEEKKLFAAKLQGVASYGETELNRIKQRQWIAEAERVVKEQQKPPPSPFGPNPEASPRQYWNPLGLNPKVWLEESRHIEPYPIRTTIPSPELEFNFEQYNELKRMWQIEIEEREMKKEEEEQEKEKITTGFLTEMTPAEAMYILNLTSEDAKDKNKVRNAYKKLMFANHPDKGGSRFIALKLSEAKDLLLKAIEKEGKTQSTTSTSSSSSSTSTNKTEDKNE